MKALVLCGSTERGGFTEAACRGVADGLSADGWEVETMFLSDLRIGHYGSEGDDMDAVAEAFASSDLAVMATPIYFSGPTSLLKAVVDRMNPYWHIKGDHPDRMAAVLVGGSPEPNFRNTLSILRSLSNTVGSAWAGELLLPGSDGSEKEAFEAKGREFGVTLSQRDRTGP